MILDIVPDIRKHIGRKLVALYTARGFNQKRLCEATGLSAPTIRAIEDGTNIPRFSNLELIASRLGVDVDYFFSGFGSEHPILAEISAYLAKHADDPGEIERFCRVVRAAMTDVQPPKKRPV